jgi:hypothetical protein
MGRESPLTSTSGIGPVIYVFSVNWTEADNLLCLMFYSFLGMRYKQSKQKNAPD